MPDGIQIKAYAIGFCRILSEEAQNLLFNYIDNSTDVAGIAEAS